MENEFSPFEHPQVVGSSLVSYPDIHRRDFRFLDDPNGYGLGKPGTLNPEPRTVNRELRTEN